MKEKEIPTRITLVPVGGLANRMCAIGAGITLGHALNAQLDVVWHKDRGLNCAFHELFAPLEGTSCQLRESNWKDKLVNDRPRKKNLFIPKLAQHFCFDDCLSEQEVLHRFHQHKDFATWCKGKRTFIAAYIYFFQGKEGMDFNMFTPTLELQEQINQITSKFNMDTIGVHIRRTDNIGSIKESPTDLFITKMTEEIEKNDNTMFYLATDSEEEKKRLTAIFTDRIITSPYKADRDSVQGKKNALVELYILAATRKIMGSAKSSFSLIASKIGHNPLELVVYEKK